MPISPSAITMLIKPAGPDCNLRCAYCFYRQKAGLFPGVKRHRMKESLLEKLVEQAMGTDCDLVRFSWQGGEPTLMGLDFFQKAVELQAAYVRPYQTVSNALQTNGTLIDRKWAEFLMDNNFLVGISFDGPAKLHNHYRRDEKGKGTHASVMRGLDVLLDAGAEVNVLTLVNDVNVQEPDAVYDFLLGTGVKFFQFVPCIEPGPGKTPASYSITPENYGKFLCGLFDRWMDSPMDISVRDFDDLLAVYQGATPGTCIHQPRCGGYMVVEHNGDVFTCDFFVTPKCRLGNINETPLIELAASAGLSEFGEQKSMFSDQCKKCKWLRFCNGGCLKHRTVLGGEVTDPSYFCMAYQMLFEHASSVLEPLKTY